MLKGSMVALVTPMLENGSVDLLGLERLIDHHIDQGTDAIVSVGTTGESATLSHEEHRQVIGQAVKYAAGRIPIIGGTGSNSTAESIEMTQFAEQAGVSACLLVVPYYNKPPAEGLYQHFRSIAEAVPIPQILYNVPSRTGIDMDNDTTVRLSEIDNIVAIKDATNDLDKGKDLIRRCPDSFAVYSGEDGTACRLMLAGGRGTISVTANVAPGLMHDMCAAAVAGDVEIAIKLDEQLQALHKAMFLQSNPIPAKWAVSEQGLIQQGIRLPLLPLDNVYHESVRDAMRIAKVF